MTTRSRSTMAVFGMGLVLGVILLTGCATRSHQPVETFVEPSQRERADEPMDDILLSDVEPLDDTILPEKRKVSVVAREADLRSVLITIAQQADVNLVMDPDVGGRVSVELRDVMVEDALEAIVSPSGLHYRLHNGLLRVYGQDLQTRLFTLDYITSKRVGTTQMSASSSGASSSSSDDDETSDTSENKVTINSMIQSDAWADIVSGLEMIVFGSTGGEAEIAGAGIDPAAASSPAALLGQVLAGATGGGGSGEVTAAVDAAVPQERLVVHPMSGVILVTASFAKLNRVADFLERIEGSSHRQVMIEAQLLEVSLADEFHFGIDWSRVPGTDDITGLFGGESGNIGLEQNLSPGEGLFQISYSNGDISALLDALAIQGDVKVLSSPRVASMNNQKAVIKVAREATFFSRRIDYETQPDGTSQPIVTVDPQRVTIGIVLDVTPQISSDGEIMMNIHPSVTELLGEDVFPPGATGNDILANAPILDVREINTVVRVKNDHMLIIGGLMKDRTYRNEEMVPIIGNIPLIGNLFKRIEEKTERVELVIAMRPKIIVGRVANEVALRELDRLYRGF